MLPFPRRALWGSTYARISTWNQIFCLILPHLRQKVRQNEAKWGKMRQNVGTLKRWNVETLKRWLKHPKTLKRWVQNVETLRQNVETLRQNAPKRWNVGTLERWNVGTLMQNVGTLVRNVGTLKRQDFVPKSNCLTKLFQNFLTKNVFSWIFCFFLQRNLKHNQPKSNVNLTKHFHDRNIADIRTCALPKIKFPN